MPQVTITASTPDALPSMPQFQTWIQAWSKSAANAVWGQPLSDANVATINVMNLGVEQISDVIQSDINAYNQTNTGDKTITVVIEES